MFQYTRFIGVLAVLIPLLGCQTAAPSRPVHMQTLVTHNHEVGVIEEARPQGVVMRISKGDHFDILELKNHIRGTWDSMVCNVSPQRFSSLVDDGTYFYAFSDRDRVDGYGYWDGLKCGIRYNKTNPMDSGVVIDARSVGGIGNDINYFDNEGAIPDIELIPMINIYGEDFQRLTVRFESFGDDYLSLHFLEEMGTENGYDRSGELIAVPPRLRENIETFDLTESKTIKIGGGAFEVIDVSPSKLVYKVIEPLKIR